jgi:predicted alpha/beta superfamily hydrolase
MQTLGPFVIPRVGQRVVRIYQPRSKKQDALRPLLVMWDGQNIFGDHGSFAGGWHVHQAIDRRSKRGKRAPIVVGIDNGGLQRGRELSPWHPRGSLSEHLLDWLELKLIPYLAQHYPIDTAAPQVAIGGSSLGGLNALYAHLTRPHAFGSALAMSPSLWFAGPRMFRLVERAKPAEFSRIYLDCGGKEGDGTLAQQAEEMSRLLRQRGWRGKKLKWRLVKRGTHHEKHWKSRMPGALKFLYDDLA